MTGAVVKQTGQGLHLASLAYAHSLHTPRRRMHPDADSSKNQCTPFAYCAEFVRPCKAGNRSHRINDITVTEALGYDIELHYVKREE